MINSEYNDIIGALHWDIICKVFYPLSGKIAWLIEINIGEKVIENDIWDHPLI